MTSQAVMPSGRTVRIAHLSDLHVAHITANLKRLGRLLVPWSPGEGLIDMVTRLAMSSWFERRALGEPLVRGAHLTHRYDPRNLTAVLRSVGQQKVDHVVVTGDLSNMGEASELNEASAALAAHGWHASNVTIMPGNHDRMNFRGTTDFRSIAGDRDYPLLDRITDEVWVIAIDSTAWGPELDWRDTLTMNARGRISLDAIQKVDAMLATLPAGATSVLCTHHHLVDLPPDGYVDDWFGQVDARLAGKAENSDVLLDVAEARGVSLILFGHRHRSTRDGFTIRSIPAACSGAVTHPDLKGDLQYRIFEYEGARLVGSQWVSVSRKDVRETEPVTAALQGDDLKVTVQVGADNLQEQMTTLVTRRNEMDRQILDRIAKSTKR
jgi:3',5'-cyclic AMP phosphodiesterase CpdA